MVALSTLKPGDVVYDSRRQKMGNTTMSHTVCWEVRIVEVHADHVIASWNSNSPKRYRPREIDRWTRSPPKGTDERKRFDERKARASGGLATPHAMSADVVEGKDHD